MALALVYSFIGRVAVLVAAVAVLSVAAMWACDLVGWERHQLNFLAGWCCYAVARRVGLV